MPYEILKSKDNNGYEVRNLKTHKIFSFNTTLPKAKKQIALLYKIDRKWTGICFSRNNIIHPINNDEEPNEFEDIENFDTDSEVNSFWEQDAAEEVNRWMINLHTTRRRNNR